MMQLMLIRTITILFEQFIQSLEGELQLTKFKTLINKVHERRFIPYFE